MAKKEMTDTEKAAAKLIKEKSEKLQAEEKTARANQAKAKKELDKIKSDAKKDAVKAKTKEKAEAAKAKTIKSLVPIAKEINVRIDKAAKMFRDADDHRLAAAIKMDDARNVCRDMKINFKEWVEGTKDADGKVLTKGNITQAYETVRKLLPIGAAENEHEGDGAVLLKDMREGNKQANKEHRAKEKANKASSSDETVAKKPQPPANRAVDALKELPDDQAAEIVKDQARRLKLNVGEKVEAETLTPLNKAKLAFSHLSDADRVTFKAWAAEQADNKPEASGEMPEHLKRPAPAKKATPTRKRKKK